MDNTKVFILLLFSVIAFGQCHCDGYQSTNDINGFQFEILLAHLAEFDSRMASYETSFSHITSALQRLETRIENRIGHVEAEINALKTLMENRYKSSNSNLQKLDDKVVKLESHMEHRLEKSSSSIISAVNNKINTHSTQILDLMKQMETKINAFDSRTTNNLSEINNKMEENRNALQSHMEKQAKNIVNNQTEYVKNTFKLPSIALECGWIPIQRRLDGSVNFFRDWNEYKNGFGDDRGEFWIGLEKIHQKTASAPHELLVVLEDFDGNIVYAYYDNFLIGNETEKYALKSLGSYSGTAGDSLNYHLGMAFTTQDMDNDHASNRNCASQRHGAWWFRSCMHSHLNGKYYHQWKVPFAMGVNWFDYRGDFYSLKSTKMMIRWKSSSSA